MLGPADHHTPYKKKGTGREWSIQPFLKILACEVTLPPQTADTQLICPSTFSEFSSFPFLFLPQLLSSKRR